MAGEENGKTRSIMARVNPVHAWAGIFVVILLALIGWFDRKWDEHVTLTETTARTGRETQIGLATEIRDRDTADKIEAAKREDLSRSQAEKMEAERVWITDVQRALEPIRDRMNKLEIQQSIFENELKHQQQQARPGRP